jgi:hypothetical protein
MAKSSVSDVIHGTPQKVYFRDTDGAFPLVIDHFADVTQKRPTLWRGIDPEVGREAGAGTQKEFGENTRKWIETGVVWQSWTGGLLRFEWCD